MSLLTVKNLTKRYNKHPVVHNISFNLNSGKCIALIGPNGAGKTTTLRMLTGLMKQTSGEMIFNELYQTDDFRTLIGYLPQHPVFHEWMTGKEYLVYCARLARMEKKVAIEKANRILDKVGIAKAKNNRIRTYSGGMKQRLGIAQAIIHDPKLLILDEPVSALDPIGRRDVFSLMEHLKQDMTILFSTHILSDADEISDELIVLHEGKVVESGEMDTLRKKYQTTKIELEFDVGIEKYEKEIKKLDTVTTTAIERNILHVSVTNIEKARQEILREASKEDWPLIRYNVNRASLEEMFMRAVK